LGSCQEALLKGTEKPRHITGLEPEQADGARAIGGLDPNSDSPATIEKREGPIGKIPYLVEVLRNLDIGLKLIRIDDDAFSAWSAPRDRRYVPIAQGVQSPYDADTVPVKPSRSEAAKEPDNSGGHRCEFIQESGQVHMAHREHGPVPFSAIRLSPGSVNVENSRLMPGM